MIYPKKNFLIKWFFSNYIRFIVKKNFYKINHNDISIDPTHSILLIANHYSWWDGFIFYWLNERLFHKNFFVMILEETVSKVSFMKYLGAFSIKKGSRDMITSLNYAASLLNEPQNLVLIFPQGKLYSNFSDHINFEKGLSKIVEKAKHNMKIVFAASFTENFKHKRPMTNVYLKYKEEISSVSNLDQAYQQFYETAKEQQTQINF